MNCLQYSNPVFQFMSCDPRPEQAIVAAYQSLLSDSLRWRCSSGCDLHCHRRQVSRLQSIIQSYKLRTHMVVIAHFLHEAMKIKNIKEFEVSVENRYLHVSHPLERFVFIHLVSMACK